MTEEDFILKISKTLEKTRSFLISKFNIQVCDIDDILQISAIKAYKNLSFFRKKCSFETWFISIAKNEAKSFCLKRQKKIEIECSDDFLRNYSFTWIDEEINNSEKDKEKETRELIKKATLSLSKKHQEVLKLMIENSLSHKDISLRLKIPINSVRTRFFYAKKTLRKALLRYESNSKY